jgi:hypothetical protein
MSPLRGMTSWMSVTAIRFPSLKLLGAGSFGCKIQWATPLKAPTVFFAKEPPRLLQTATSSEAS